MSYTVKEIYYTLQGEGVHTGRGAVFLRFAGCNLWSGREEDRATATCQFCDTDFVGMDGSRGGRYASADELAIVVEGCWNESIDSGNRFCVCTGGEPLLQLDEALIQSLKERGFEVAVETNGTLEVPAGIDWVCVSPKAGAELVQTSGHELKIVFPQGDLDPSNFLDLDFDHFSLQPMDGADAANNLRITRDYCLKHPRWRLSLQVHKILGIP